MHDERGRRSPVAVRPDDGVEALLQRIGAEFASLSRQLKVIARYVAHHHEFLGLQRIQDVADRCGVQPSAVVRFAKHFGYSGYHELKRLFLDDGLHRAALHPPGPSRLREAVSHSGPLNMAGDLVHAVIDGALDGLQQLRRDLRVSAIGDAVDLILPASMLWVVGAHRSFPLATFLVQALQETPIPVQLVHFSGGMHEGQLRSVRRTDVVIAVSLAPHADETALVVQLARACGARVLAITDSCLSPLIEEAEVTLLVQAHATRGLPSMSNALVLAQGLMAALAWRLERADLADGHRDGDALPARSHTA